MYKSLIIYFFTFNDNHTRSLLMSLHSVNKDLETPPPLLNREIISEKKLMFLNCLLEEHSFHAIMHSQAQFFHNATQADIVAICTHNTQHLNMELLGQARLKLLRIFKRYHIQPNKMSFKNFLKHYNEDIQNIDSDYLELKSLKRIFDGALDEHQYALFEKEIGFTSAIIFPINDRNGVRIGYTIFFYFDNHNPLKENLPLISSLLESVMQPLYDTETKTFYAKVERISTYIPELTAQEKTITSLLLKGYPNTAIAKMLNISINTVKTHVKNIFSKYDVNSKMELSHRLKKIDI